MTGGYKLTVEGTGNCILILCRSSMLLTAELSPVPRRMVLNSSEIVRVMMWEDMQDGKKA